jgi:hypothetical protein
MTTSNGWCNNAHRSLAREPASTELSAATTLEVVVRLFTRLPKR